MSRPTAKRVALRLLVSLAIAFAILEGTLHMAPGLLPTAYLHSFPMGGVEFFEPGILARTPIEAVPLPLRHGSYEGTPPADLVELGIVSRDVDYDRVRFPDVFLPTGENGFPNEPGATHADLLIVGDSFAVATGVTRPAGLQVQLARATGLDVFNIGVSAIGPVREEWLMENVGLGKNPRCVIWFFFSGNDASGSIYPLVHKRKGLDTFAEVHADRMPPRLILPDVLRHLFAARDVGRREALPGFPFTLCDGTKQDLWFNPAHLGLLHLTVEQWEANIGWRTARDILVRASKTCRERGVAFLLVYVPSKAEVYLPHVEATSELAHRTASYLLPEPVPVAPDVYLRQLLERRDSLERVVRSACEAESITFLSATPHLDRLAREGELGYLVTDTHWQVVGQSALLAPLLEALRSLDVLDD